MLTYDVYRNAPRIGMLFGTGIELGIGILAHPVKDMAVIRIIIADMMILGLFLNPEVSPFYMYYKALYKGSGKGFPAIF